MDKTAKEILDNQGDWRDNPNGEMEILDAMEIYAKQEALSFASWIINKGINFLEGKTKKQLWKEYTENFK